MANNTLNMNKFFGNDYSMAEGVGGSQAPIAAPMSADISKEIEKSLAPLEKEIGLLKNENKQENDVIVKINNSFGDLESASSKIKLSIDNLIGKVMEDIEYNIQKEKNDSNYYSRQTQKAKSAAKSALSAGENEKSKNNEQAAGVLSAVPAFVDTLKNALGDGGQQQPDAGGDQVSSNAGDYKNMLNLIASVESTSYGGYNAFNLGGTDQGRTAIDPGNSTKDPIGGTVKPLTERTLKEVLDLQSSRQLFAAGRYQFIPDTLKGVVNSGRAGVSLGDKFNSSTQDKLAIALIKTLPASVEAFRGTWIGLQNVEAKKIQSAIDDYKNKNSQRNTQNTQASASRSTPTIASSQSSSNTQASGPLTKSTTVASASGMSEQTTKASANESVTLAQAGILVQDGDQSKAMAPSRTIAPSLSPITNESNYSLAMQPLPIETKVNTGSIAANNTLLSNNPVSDSNNVDRLKTLAYIGLGGIA